jgi:hypothetical protein
MKSVIRVFTEFLESVVRMRSRFVKSRQHSKIENYVYINQRSYKITKQRILKHLYGQN